MRGTASTDVSSQLLRGWMIARVCAVMVVSCGILTLSACQKPSQQVYELKGTIVSVDAQRHLVTIAHEDIPGYMDAMTMPFSLKEDWPYEVATAGDRIQATLVVLGDRSWLENVTITREQAASDEENTEQASPAAFAPFPAPNFALTDQDQQPVTLSSLHGKIVVLDFIFTRCPGPCPLLSLKFSQVQKQLGERLGKDVMLLSITIDPRHDTPEVLKAYAQRYAANLAGWKFLTGTTKDIILTAAAFGADYKASEDGILDHRLVTCVIDRDGIVVREFPGTDYSVEELIAEITERLQS
ncbi:MAG: SCO family protein [Candidatus Binatia bacterium]